MGLLHKHNCMGYRLASRQAGLDLLDFWINRAKTLPKQSTGLNYSNICSGSIWMVQDCIDGGCIQRQHKQFVSYTGRPTILRLPF